MNFRKKIQNSNQIVQHPRRVDGIFTYASIQKLKNQKRKVFDLSRPLTLQRKIKSDENGAGKIVVPNFTYKKYKKIIALENVSKFFGKSRKMFAFNPIFAKRAISSFLILIIVAMAFFQSSHDAQGATYAWQQTKWSGGQTSNTDVHPGKVGGWDEYSSKDSFVKTVNSGNDVELSWTPGSSVQTSDTGAQDTPNGGGFNAGQHLRTKGRGAGSSARVDLGYGGIAAISSGLGHTLLISDNNKVWAWGQNESGQLGDATQTARLTPVQIRNSTDSDYLSNIEAVAAGNNHSLALDGDGTVWAWGDGSSGQLGNGSGNSILLPAKVKNFNGVGTLSDVIAIAAGNGYSVALKKDGTVWAWGANGKGQLGNATNTSANLPVQVLNLAQVSMIASGANSQTTLASTSDGNVWAWGDGSLDQLGNGSLADSNVPLQVLGISNVTAINGGKNRSVAIKADKTVWAWGSNASGELGNGTNNSSSVPVQVLNLTDVTSIGGGSNHSLAIKSDGSVWAWGGNNNGQLGDGTVSNKSTPVSVTSFGSGATVMISGGEGFSVALKLDGTVWAWGANFNGKLGVNDAVDRNTPVQVWNSAQGTSSGFSAISSGSAHNIGLKNDGTVWAWGKNGLGQLGDGTSSNRLTPVQVVGLSGIIAIVAGYNHSLALKSDGTVWSWGWNAYGQLGDGTQDNQSLPVKVKASAMPDDYLQNITAISLGDTHSLALDSNGNVWAWGGNGSGQLGIGSTDSPQLYPQQVKDSTGSEFLTNVHSISGGGYYSLVSLDDGTAWSWGINDQGQLGNGDFSKTNKSLPVQIVDASLLGITNVAKVNAGYAHAFALLNDASLLAWGWNDYGQLGTSNINSTAIALPVSGAGASNVSMVKAGHSHTIVLKDDGTVWSWGWNAYGQLGNGNTISSISPVQVGGGVGTATISAISCGDSYSTALTSLASDGGTVWTWGGNDKGQLGQNNNKTRFSPVQVWGPASGAINAGHTSYFSGGIFNSAIIDSGSIKTFTTANYSITTPANTTVTVDIRAGNTTNIGESSWVSLTNVSSGGDISALGQKRYYQYSVNMMTTNLDTTPSFNDITLNYNYFPSPGRLISSPYDTSDASNILSKIAWSQTVAASSSVHFQVRTAHDQGGLPGTWTAWVGTDGTSNSYFTDNIGGQVMPSLVTDGSGDQWIQYQAFLISDGVNSPTLSDVGVQYVVNAPPEVSSVSASQGSDGIVTVNYQVRDPDSSVPQNVTPLSVIIGLQYCKSNCTLAGSEEWVNAATIGGSVGPGIVVEDVAFKSYQLTWNAKTDIDQPGIFNSGFKVRVVANDSEGANNFGYGKSNAFVFDTKDPVNVGFFIDHTTNKLHLTSPIDDSTYQMIVSNFADYHDATYQSFPSVQNIFDYPSLAADPALVHLKIKDAYGNYKEAVETTPIKLSDAVFYDISNKAIGEYRELISWKAPAQGEMGSGGFAKYNIWRSMDGSSYSLVNSITDKNVNYYLDSGLTDGVTYYYKMTLEDADGNISAFSAIVSDIPNGEGGANITPAVISNVSVPNVSINSNSAIITWDSDIQSNSTVGFSTTAGDFSNEVGNATLVTSGHSVTITGLDQNQTYYFRVKSMGVDNSVSVNDNFAMTGKHEGYFFKTTAADVTAPTISGITSTPLTTSASIAWLTGEAATSFVEYSTNAGFSVGNSFGSYDLNLSHTVTLPSILSPDTTYYFKIHSKDGAGNEAVSGQQSFKTASLGDTTAPIISAVSVFSKTHNAAVINWTTDEASTSYVEYGTTTSYGKTFGNSNLVSGPTFSHSISLPQDLVPETLYHFRIHSTDAVNNEAFSDDYSFTTNVDPRDIVAPTLTAAPTVTATSATSATITWTTDEDSTSFVDYSPTLGNFQLEQGSSLLAQSHSVMLVNLIPDTLYYYQIKSADASNNVLLVNNAGAGFTFATSSGQPPVLQGAPLATQDSFDAFTISWTTNESATSFVELSTASDFSNSLVFGKYNSVKNHAISLLALSPATTYFYRVRSSAEFEMVSGSYSFVTSVGPDTTAPLISNILISKITDNGATISWDTSENADSILYIGETANYDKIFGNSGNLILNHAVDVAGLSSATTYFYQIVSKDSAGNVTYGAMGSFTTNSLGDAPQIDKVVAAVAADVSQPATYNQVTITWDTDVVGDSKVSFSQDGSFDKSIYHPTDLISSGHSIVISDLALDTTYKYKVSTRGTNGITSINSEKSFKTAKDPKYLHDPLKTIDNVVATPDASSASVTFSTDQLAKCVIEYRLDGQAYPGGLTSESSFNQNHHMQILPLVGLTKYYFRINCQDNIDSTPVTSNDFSFTTVEVGGAGGTGTGAGIGSGAGVGVDKILPIISGISVGKATGEGVVITWKTDKKASSYVRYGTKSTFGFMVGNDLVNFDQTKYDVTHTVTLDSLIPATRYYYSVVSIDGSGNIAESAAGTFTTATQSTLDSISIVSKVLGEATVTWTTVQSMTSGVEYGLTNNYGSKVESSSQAKLHEVSLTKLVVGQPYHFRVRSVDSVGNIFVSGDYAFQPKSPPVITNVAVTEVTESGATVTFSTNVPSDAVAAYVATNDSKNSGSQGQTSLVLAHSVALKNLSPGTEYSLKVQAKDESGNSAELAGPNFTIGKDTTPPNIDKIHTDSALTQNDKVQSIISWTTDEGSTTSIMYREGKNSEEKEAHIGEAYVANHLAVMTVFKPGAVYYFKVKSVDEAGNEAVSSDFALLTPKKKENIIQIIINNFQEIFHWASV